MQKFTGPGKRQFRENNVLANIHLHGLTKAQKKVISLINAHGFGHPHSKSFEISGLR